MQFAIGSQYNRLHNYDMCAMQSVEADGCTVDEKIVTSRCGKCCSPTMRG